MTLKTFKRFEKKYLINETQFMTITKGLSKTMIPDRYSCNGACYKICNIYYDTPDNEIIRNSISKPYYKEKLRLRSYCIPETQDDKVFLELKKKIGGIVSKRRAVLRLGEACEFVRTGKKPKVEGYANNQILDEIALFIQTYKLEAKVVICYDRIAYFGKDDKDFRITFDKNIATRRTNLSLEKGASGELLLQNNTYVMEIKINHAFPMWLAALLSENRIYSTSFSKYGKEYMKYKTRSEIYAGKYLYNISI